MNREQQVEAARVQIRATLAALQDDNERWRNRAVDNLAEAIVDRLSPSGAGEERKWRIEAVRMKDKHAGPDVPFEPVRVVTRGPALKQGESVDVVEAASPSGADPQPDLRLAAEQVVEAYDDTDPQPLVMAEEVEALRASLSGGAGQQEPSEDLHKRGGQT